ncbi:MAG: hypothetical protein ACLU3I_19925 [Acutalibacteraceae bacterium]
MIANAAHALERVSRVSDEMRQLSGKLNDLMYTARILPTSCGTRRTI